MNFIKSKLCPKQDRMRKELSRLSEVVQFQKTSISQQHMLIAKYQADINEWQNSKADVVKLVNYYQDTIRALADSEGEMTLQLENERLNSSAIICELKECKKKIFEAQKGASGATEELELLVIQRQGETKERELRKSEHENTIQMMQNLMNRSEEKAKELAEANRVLAAKVTYN
jgi:hypothetical protein